MVFKFSKLISMKSLGLSVFALLATVPLLATSAAHAQKAPAEAVKSATDGDGLATDGDGLVTDGDDGSELENKVDAIAADLNDLRESLYVPEQDEKKSVFGMGPAASKIYGRPSGLSLGGYGEFYYSHDLDKDEASSADIYRYIQYVGYKFNKNIVMNAELEFEHATTGSNPANGEKGSVSVEFAYLDFLLNRYINIRTGLLLMPVGIINEMHEPTTYHGNFRPEVERRIIPSTWREAGVGIFGALSDELTYKLYIVNGLSSDGFSSKGIRGGRQKGNHVAFEDAAVVLRTDYNVVAPLTLGGSFYIGGADHDPTGERTEANGIAEGHFLLRHAGAELRGLFAYGFIFVDDPDPDDPDDVRLEVPESQWGYYLEGAYDLWPHLSGRPGMSLSPFARFEHMNLRASPEPENAALKTVELVAGVQFKPISDVVLKLEFSTKHNDDDTTGSEEAIRVGAGFIY